MKKAVVIRMVGDADMGSAMANALVQPIETEELKAVRAEVERLRSEEAKNGVRKPRDEKYFRRKIRRANRKCPVRPPCKAAQAVLLAWALTCLTVQECYHKLSEWNREQ